MGKAAAMFYCLVGRHLGWSFWDFLLVFVCVSIGAGILGALFGRKKTE